MVGVVTLRLLQTIAQNGAAEPPVGQNRRGCPHEHSISVDDDGPWRGRLGSRMCMLGNPMHHGQLQHGGALPLTELCHQHTTSIREFDSIMVTMRNIRIDRAKFPDAEIDGFGPDPSVVVSDIFRECQFGPGKHADRYLGLLF